MLLETLFSWELLKLMKKQSTLLHCSLHWSLSSSSCLRNNPSMSLKCSEVLSPSCQKILINFFFSLLSMSYAKVVKRIEEWCGMLDKLRLPAPLSKTLKYSYLYHSSLFPNYNSDYFLFNTPSIQASFSIFLFFFIVKRNFIEIQKEWEKGRG